MSLVGTRPPTVDEWDKYELHHRARLATKPGLTGMWQVSGRSKSTWTRGVYKNIWIEQFKKMSLLAYEKADMVTCLYDHAKDLQMELGCPPEKIRVTPNGINTQTLADLPGKTEEEKQFINAGAVLRVTPMPCMIFIERIKFREEDANY